MPQSIKTGFVGAGFASTFHYDSLLQTGLTGIDPVGVHSRGADGRNQFAGDRGIKAFSSIEELLESVDVVHVCTPAVTHESVTVAALKRNVHVIVEKPFTGYFGPEDDPEFEGSKAPKEPMRAKALASAKRMIEAESESRGNIFYAENWLYSPVVQKEAEIISKTKAQILRLIAEESHSGSHSPSYGMWKYSGGGSLMGKACHPLTAVLYLKRVEGEARRGKPIRPKAVSCRTHELTRIPDFEDRGQLRTDYTDVEDFGLMHIIFDDGTVADVFASEIVMGGVYNWIEVFANNHRTRCNINPIDALETYNPVEKQFEDIYVVEKISTKQGWSKPAADENWMTGYVQELRTFYESILSGKLHLDYGELGYDTVDAIYSAYLSAERLGEEVGLVG